MNTLATLLIIMWVTVLIGICFIVKRLVNIEEKMIKSHNHLVDSLDHFMHKETNHYENLGNEIDNLQYNWSDLKTGNIQVLTVK